MHNTVQSINTNVKTLEKRDLSPDGKNVVNAVKVIAEPYQIKQSNGLAMTLEDERVLNALLIIVVYIAQDNFKILHYHTLLNLNLVMIT